ncbi:DUF2802 domain-containing protein [Glaciecola sp. 2405UD65-10]|uniref:DUF2802 domain-containing protein n=1 Tax=Glaciecola sp. 2405UD65-10 TaxID=3397244 RepID=UPI003B5A61A7
MNLYLSPEKLTLLSLVMLVVIVLLCVVFYQYAKTVNTRLGQSIKLINDLYQLLKKQEEQLKAFAQNNSANTEQLSSSIQDEVSEIRHQLALNSQELRQLENQTQQLQHQDPGIRMYTKANELVAAGASLEDIMEACELPRAEAEVLIGLHRSKQS